VVCSLEGATTVDASATALLEALDGAALARRRRPSARAMAADCTHVGVVVTSRTRLASANAHRFDVGALDVPGERASARVGS
jgi:hypothetical protein